MKILYVLNSGKPGGMEQHVLDLVKCMKTLAHEVFVWCPEGEVVGWYTTAGAKVTVTTIKFDVDPIYIVKLAKFLRENRIDVIHSHELKASTNALLAGALAKTKVRISHIHTPMSQWQISPLKKSINAFKLFGYATLVKLFATKEIALTESIKRTKIKEGIPESKLFVIPNGIELYPYDKSTAYKAEYKKETLEKYNLPQDAFVFGCVGRITAEKGHDILVKAFAELIKLPAISKNVYLFLAGGGTLQQQTQDLVNSLNIQDRVRITGIFPAEEKLKLFNSMDIFVFPTLAEGFGIVLAEAMALQIPSIVSDLEVLQELGGSTCFYFETANVQSLQNTMLDVYLKRDNLFKLKQSSLVRVAELFSMERFGYGYANLYSAMLENTK